MDTSAHTSGLPRIAILGAGNMGTALAQALALQGRSVSLWDHFPEVVREIREHRTNRRFLPAVNLDPGIHASLAPEECVRGAGIVALCVPSAFAADTLRLAAGTLDKDAVLLNVAKGFAPGGTEILPAWLERLAPGHQCAHLAGPALANEFARGRPSFIVIAAKEQAASVKVACGLAGSILRPSVTTDLKGATLCGILKNSYAIFLGLLERQGPGGRNLEASALALCGWEMESILVALGADPSTVRGLAGIGDLMATGIAPDSHNRKIGASLGGGESLEQIRSRTGWMPEGVQASPLLLELAAGCGQQPPLLEFLCRVLAGTKPDAGEIMDALDQASGSFLHWRQTP